MTEMADYWEPRNWENLISGIETPGFLPEEASPEAHEAQRDSGHTRLRRRFLEVARDIAQEEGFPDPYAPRSQDLIGEALDVASQILYAFPSLGSDDAVKIEMSAYDVRKRLSLSYPSVNGSEMVEMVRMGCNFNIDIGKFEKGVKAYLESDFRGSEIDRTIITVLIDAKTTGFVKALIERPTIGGKYVWFNYSLEKTANRTLLGVWLEGRFVSVVIATALVIPTLIIAYLVGLPSSAVDVIFFLALGYVGVEGIWQLVKFPRARTELAELRDRVLGGIAHMREIYSAYHSTDDSFFMSLHPISVPRLRADVERLAANHIVWPQSLWAMLDDIEERGLRRL